MPRDQTSAVTVAAVVHGISHPLFERWSRQRALDADFQCLLRNPSATELVDAFRGWALAFVVVEEHELDQAACFCYLHIPQARRACFQHRFPFPTERRRAGKWRHRLPSLRSLHDLSSRLQRSVG